MQIETMVVALLGLTALSSQAAAQERKLKRSDLPPAVQRVADEQSRGARVRGYSAEKNNGRVVYEVEMTEGGHSRDVTIDSAGTVLEVEQQVVLDSLPAEVQAGLRKLAGAGHITTIESLTKHGTLVAYEARVRTGAKHSEVQVGPDGKPLAHPE